MQSTEQRVLDLAKLVRRPAPLYAAERLGSFEIEAVQSLVHMVVEHVDALPGDRLAMPYPRPGGGIILRVARALPYAVERILILRHIARALLSPDEPPLTADVFAFAGVFHLAFISGPGGVARTAERIQLLKTFPGLWEGRSFTYLRDVAEDVIIALHRDRLGLVHSAPEGEHEKVWGYGQLEALRDASIQHRESGRFSEAEEGFRELGRRASASGEKEMVFWAYMGLGNVYWRRGKFPRARSMFAKAARAARRTRNRDLYGRPLHSIFAMCVDADDAQGAHDYAARTFAAYGWDHPQAVALIHDVAAFWIACGYHDAAYRVLKLLGDHLHAPMHRIRWLGNMAQAAGACGALNEFERAAQEVSAAAMTSTTGEATAAAYLAVAHGARSLGLRERARASAECALQIALMRREARVRLEAEAVLDSVSGGQVSPTPCRRVCDQESESLAAAFLACLNQRSGAVAA